jgi:hypothetical protein
MEAPQKIVLPGEVHPVRNSSPAIAGLETERGIISNGVNIISYCALDSAHCRPVRRVEPLDYKIQSAVTQQPSDSTTHDPTHYPLTHSFVFY